jgi:hypothetical protein
MAGPLTGVLPVARAMARQGGGPSIPSWVLATAVHVDSAAWLVPSVVSRCLREVTAEWLSQHPFVGAGDRSAGDSAAWLVPSVVSRCLR